MGTRKPLVVGNWKMNRTSTEAVALARELRTKLSMVHAVEVVICPGFTALESVSRTIEGSNLALGAQDCFWEREGAFTGEVSPMQLKAVGCGYVVLGHSERRQLGETSEQVHRKLLAALPADLIPIVCVGESAQEREANETFAVVSQQTERSLGTLSAAQASQVVVAYEPVWAIGTGRQATPVQAQQVHAMLRDHLGKLLGPQVAGAMRLLYGGSVKASNARELLTQPDVDGALVGGASLQAEEFAAIVKANL